MDGYIDPSEDRQDYPVVSNGEIAPALEDVDERGWSKDATWVMQAESSGACGDYAIGPYYQGHYRKQGSDGSWMVVEENYFIEARKLADPDEGTERKHFDVVGSYTFTVCTDPDDPGSTELDTEIVYDDQLHALFIWDYEEARAMAERLARADQRHTLLWDGGERVLAV